MTRRQEAAPARPVWTSITVAVVLTVALVGCIVQGVRNPQLTGTCEGACAHYVQCKTGHSDMDRNRCVAECPGVFGDRDSLLAYESLTCDDAVEYIDGNKAKTAAHHGN